MTQNGAQAGSSQRRKVALVTGATGAIGKAIAERIAARADFEVVLSCRDAARAEAAVLDIRHRTGNREVRFELADLGRKASIEALAKRWHGPAHSIGGRVPAGSRQTGPPWRRSFGPASWGTEHA